MSIFSVRQKLPVGTLAISLSLLAATTSEAQVKSAQDSARRDSIAKARTLDDVVITATRSSSAARDVPQKVDVITSKDIAQSVAVDVTNILKKHGSVDVIEYPNFLSGVSIRGFRPETGTFNRRSIVLIDGRPSGVGNLAAIPVDQIDRIEVVKGAASSLYGSSAMGGAINIITKKNMGPLRSGASIAYGSFQTTDLSGFTGGKVGEFFDFDFSARDYRRGDDFKMGKGNWLRGSLGDKYATKILGEGVTQKVRDLGDGQRRSSTTFNSQNGSLRVGSQLADNMRVDLRGDLFRARDVSYPGDIAELDTGNGRKDLDRKGLDLLFSGTYKSLVPRIRAYTHTFDNNAYDDTTSSRYVNFVTSDVVRGAQIQNVFSFGAHTVSTGIDYSWNKATSQRFDSPTNQIAPYSPSSKQSSIAAFAQAHWRALGDRLTGTIGGRIDRITLHLLANAYLPNLSEGKHSFTTFNPSAGLQYRTTDGVRFHTSVGRAFLSPDAYDMAGQSKLRSGAGTGDTITLTAGNPNITPENAITFDFGMGVSEENFGFDADVTYFRTQVTDRITRVTARFAPGSEPTMSDGDVVRQIQTPVNASRAVMHGLEVEFGYDFGRLMGSGFVLRGFANGTNYFSAYDHVRTPSIDTAAFPPGITDFSPSDVSLALKFGARTRTRIRNLAPLTVTTGLEFNSLGRWTGRISSRYVGKRIDTDFSGGAVSDILYAPHAVVDIVGGYQVSSLLRVDASISNASDENYYEKRGYNLPGRAMQIKFSIAR